MKVIIEIFYRSLVLQYLYLNTKFDVFILIHVYSSNISLKLFFS